MWPIIDRKDRLRRDEVMLCSRSDFGFVAPLGIQRLRKASSSEEFMLVRRVAMVTLCALCYES